MITKSFIENLRNYSETACNRQIRNLQNKIDQIDDERSNELWHLRQMLYYVQSKKRYSVAQRNIP